MTIVKVSPKYQIVIPRKIRESMDLRPGQEVSIMRLGERIEIVPLRPLEDMRGFIRGIDSRITRDPDRDL